MDSGNEPQVPIDYGELLDRHHRDFPWGFLSHDLYIKAVIARDKAVEKLRRAREHERNLKAGGFPDSMLEAARQSRLDAANESDLTFRARQKAYLAREEANKRVILLQNREMLKVLREVRPFGFPEGVDSHPVLAELDLTGSIFMLHPDFQRHHGRKSSPVAIERLNSAMPFYPTAWVERSMNTTEAPLWPIANDPVMRLPSDKSKLRSHHAQMNALGVNATEFLLSVQANEFDQEATAIHEFAHRVEAQSPKIHATIREWYDERTKGEDLRPLGHPYHPSEMYRPDQFAHKYIGKDYSHGNSEVLSMGAEALLSSGYQAVEEGYGEIDPGFFDLVAGILASAD